MNRTKAIVAAAAAVVVLAIAAFVAFGRGGNGDGSSAARPASTGSTTTSAQAAPVDDDLVAASGFGDPGDVEVPPVAEPDAVVSYLTGEAAPLLEFRSAVQPLISEEPVTAAGCADLAADLDEGPKPEMLLAMATETPDGPTGDLLAALVSGTPAALQTCDGDGAARAELAWQAAVLDARLHDLGLTS